MDNESIQADVPVPAKPEPAVLREHPLDRFSRETLEKDKQHLRLLSIFYYIYAGIMAFTAVMSLLYFALGLIFFLAPPSPNGPPPWFGFLFLGLGSCFLIVYGVKAYLLYVAGKSLSTYKRRTFIFVTAIIACVMGGMLGIALGVFTFVVLSRESVKVLFEHGEPARPHDEDA